MAHWRDKREDDRRARDFGRGAHAAQDLEILNCRNIVHDAIKLGLDICVRPVEIVESVDIVGNWERKGVQAHARKDECECGVTLGLVLERREVARKI